MAFPRNFRTASNRNWCGDYINDQALSTCSNLPHARGQAATEFPVSFFLPASAYEFVKVHVLIPAIMLQHDDFGAYCWQTTSGSAFGRICLRQTITVAEMNDRLWVASSQSTGLSPFTSLEQFASRYWNAFKKPSELYA